MDDLAELPKTVSMVQSVWASSARDVWVAGAYDTIARFDGSSWTTFGRARSLRWDAIRGVDARDVWAAGTDGHVDHFDGRSWSAVPSGVG
jgi:hypothetical protein